MKVLLLVLSFALGTVFAGQNECVHVTGHCECPSDRTKHGYTRVQIVDENTLRSDTIMDEGYTAESGFFNLYGCSKDAFGDIDPEFHIFHRCGSSEGQAKEWVHVIDKADIGKAIDLGRIDLSKLHPKFKEKKYKKNVGPDCKKDE